LEEDQGNNGVSNPESVLYNLIEVRSGIEVVATASDQAQQALGTDASDMPSTPVDLVVLHGSFVDTMSKAPAGEPDPSGSVAAYTVDQASGKLA
jgi:hypothetical protein